jgi:hypothetical protein
MMNLSFISGNAAVAAALIVISNDTSVSVILNIVHHELSLLKFILKYNVFYIALML